MIRNTSTLPGGTTTRAIGLAVLAVAVAAVLLGLLAGVLGQQAPTDAGVAEAPATAAPGLAPSPGPISGQEPAAPSGPESSSTPHAASRHLVADGETLAGIAQATGVPVELLAADNGIDDPDRVATGTVLDVSVSPSNVVVIAEGTTLGEYAAQYDTSVDRLLADNPQIADADHIEAGDGLRVART